ncbi:hypothetical protein AABC73_20190 [Pseudomonas sp. G.S.17]|uniref:hypothetical protein n=1 Tax=Pseudomonas sp. G.S.17 TaxID=3137451 RepID=UPI00311CB7DE
MKHCIQGRKISSVVMLLSMVIAVMVGQFAGASPRIETSDDVIPLSVWKNWKFLGGLDMYASRHPGDVVKVRFFSPANEELHAFSSTVREDDKGSHRWALRLLDQIQTANIGVVPGNPNVHHGGLENYGWGVTTRYFYAVAPDRYSRAISEVHHVGGGVTTQPADDGGSMIFDAPSIVKKGDNFTFQIGGGGGTGTRNVAVSIFDAGTDERVALKQDVVTGTYAPVFDVRAAQSWVGPLTMIATVTIRGEPSKSYMKVQSLQLKDAGSYDHAFPENVAGYKAGTKVLQPKNQRVYECKPFPYSGYCIQWSGSNTQFEPGIGSNWQEAWILRP